MSISSWCSAIFYLVRADEIQARPDIGPNDALHPDQFPSPVYERVPPCRSRLPTTTTSNTLRCHLCVRDGGDAILELRHQRGPEWCDQSLEDGGWRREGEGPGDEVQHLEYALVIKDSPMSVDGISLCKMTVGGYRQIIGTVKHLIDRNCPRRLHTHAKEAIDPRGGRESGPHVRRARKGSG